MSYNATNLKHTEGCKCPYCQLATASNVVGLKYTTKWTEFVLQSIYFSGVWWVHYTMYHGYDKSYMDGDMPLDVWNKTVERHNVSE